MTFFGWIKPERWLPLVRTWAILLLVLQPAQAADKPQWIVVTAPAYRAAIEPLCEHRKAEGMQVVVVPTSDVLTADELRAGKAAKLRDRVVQLCRQSKGTSYVLLVGAVEAGQLTDPERKVLPPLPGTISRMKGEPSDNGYGCANESLLPTVAVGRLPARSEDEARSMVQKILASERDTAPGEWRRRLTVLAGIPAFNPIVDKLVETQALAHFDRLDPAWSGRAIYHNAQSRFCVPDNLVYDRARQYVQGGQALTIYLGHSNVAGFYAGQAHYLDREDWAALKIARGPGIFATFGCNGCQLKGMGGEGYGVAAIRNPQGPAAVLGSHGICFAAMTELASIGLFESFRTPQMPERLGETWLAVKTSLAKGKLDDLAFLLLDQVDGDPKIPQATQRLEHLEMFVLLGDPALRWPILRADIPLKVPEAVAAADKAIPIQGELPGRLKGARIRVTLERALTSEPGDLQPLPQAPVEERRRVMLANHDRANRFVLAAQELTVAEKRFETRLALPERPPWPRLLVRVYAVADRQEGMGVARVNVKP